MSEQDKVYTTTEVFAALVAMACEQNPQFREKFSHDPRGMLNKYVQQQQGTATVADNLNIVVHENDDDTLHVAVPAYKTVGPMALSDEQLEQIAAGEVVAAALLGLGITGASAVAVSFGTAAALKLGAISAIALGAAIIGATAVGVGAVTAGSVASVVVGGLAVAGEL